MKNEHIIGLVVLVLSGLGLAFLFLSPSGDSKSTQSEGTEQGVRFTEIVEPSGFVNTDGITLGELVGKKVILADFLTYSCINCQRTFPYMNAWYEKYKDQGLEIIGIHTPEFAFEKDRDNVVKAMKKYGITYPIVMDNDYNTWNAYGNRYWPRKYLIDIHGNVVYDHIGEGAYEETEMKIRELLEERRKVLGESDSGELGALAIEGVPETTISSRSPETYFGSERNEYLENGKRGISGELTFSLLGDTYKPNALYLGGTWDIDAEHAESVQDSSVIYRYYAKEVYIVAETDTEGQIEVWQDGKPVGTSGGVDVGSDGIVQIGESGLYKLILNDTAGEHVLELRLKGSGVRLFAFTFG